MNPMLNRREMIRSSLGVAALGLLNSQWLMFGAEAPTGTPIPFLDPQPHDPKRPMVQWQELTSWVTPTSEFFAVSHYGNPEVAASDWHLDFTGLVQRPLRLSLAEIKRLPRKEMTATLECSGNGVSPGFMGAIGNARWTGTPLGPLLKKAGLKKEAIELVFFGADQKSEKIRDKDYLQNFARSLSIEDALKKNILLAYEMNGEPLTRDHGFPLRLVVPGWYGIAWVKWLQRIEAQDRRYMSKFMARDYVTIRGEEVGGHTIWRETSVTRMNLKSIVARAVRTQSEDVHLSGAAWTDGTRLKAVEVKIDDGPWLSTRLHKNETPYAWTFFSYLWNKPAAGEHTLVSRAFDEAGRIQPSADDPVIKLKKTYWEANQQVPRRIRV